LKDHSYNVNQNEDQTDEESHPLFTPKRKLKFSNKDEKGLERRSTPGYGGVEYLQYF
jgi:hypothetical protein